VAQIRLLFAAGEQGAWYDPSDLSTLYQDSAGTTPVTALGQPVGLMLDKSKGLALGPELVTNGGFDTDTAGWSIRTATQGLLSWNAGAMRFESQTGLSRAASQLISGFVVGRSYLISYKGRLVSGAGGHQVQLRSSDGGGGSDLTATTAFTNTEFVTRTEVWVATQTSAYVSARVTADATVAEFDNISVRELPGNHASQPTATARPVLAAGNKIDFDGVDDKLTTTFPDLGTAVTIVRSVPGTGASILTGQTIGAGARDDSTDHHGLGAGARDDSTDHHGLLIINRALTAPETALVTRWANMRAGV